MTTTEEQPSRRRRAHLGTINVESGTVTIGDPCYLNNLKRKFDSKVAKAFIGWQGVDEATMRLIEPPLLRDGFIAFPAECLTMRVPNDGEYNVFGTFVTIPPSLLGDVAYERLAKVEIVFIEEEGAEENADND